jgi:aconitate hydratase
VKEKEWSKLTAGLIDSCTNSNSSFEDLTRAASVAHQALDAGTSPKMPLLASPGGLQTRKALEQAGIIDVLEKFGATMLTNTCGPCY